MAGMSLPDEAVAALLERRSRVQAKPDDPQAAEAFAAYVRALHKRGHWPMADIAAGLDTTAAEVRALVHQAEGITMPDVPQRVVARRDGGSGHPSKAAIDSRTAKRLQHLVTLAREVRGATPADDPRRKASTQLAELVAQLRADGKAPRDIALAAGQPWRTLRARMARHGLCRRPPSVRPYQGGRPPKTHCVKDHEFTDENTLIVVRRDGSKVRHCRTCNRNRQSQFTTKHVKETAKPVEQRADRDLAVAAP